MIPIFIKSKSSVRNCFRNCKNGTKLCRHRIYIIIILFPKTRIFIKLRTIVFQVQPWKCWQDALREMCPYSELFWSAFSRIRTEYGEIICLSVFCLNAENADQNNSNYGHFSRSEEDLVHNFLSYALSQEELDVRLDLN